MMLAPRDMVGFSESSCHGRSIARPSYTSDLVLTIPSLRFFFRNVFAGVGLGFLGLLLVFTEFIIEIVIILIIIVIVSSIFLLFFHLLKCLLSGVIGIDEIEISDELVDLLSLLNSIILPNDIVIVESVGLSILV